jgi:hypothetical protein
MHDLALLRRVRDRIDREYAQRPGVEADRLRALAPHPRSQRQRHDEPAECNCGAVLPSTLSSAPPTKLLSSDANNNAAEAAPLI